MNDVCKGCRFGRFVDRRMFRDAPNMESKRAHVICRRYPKHIEVAPDHWCGEFSAALADASPDIGKEGIGNDVK